MGCRECSCVGWLPFSVSSHPLFHLCLTERERRRRRRRRPSAERQIIISFCFKTVLVSESHQNEWWEVVVHSSVGVSKGQVHCRSSCKSHKSNINCQNIWPLTHQKLIRGQFCFWYGLWLKFTLTMCLYHFSFIWYLVFQETAFVFNVYYISIISYYVAEKADKSIYQKFDFIQQKEDYYLGKRSIFIF